MCAASLSAISSGASPLLRPPGLVVAGCRAAVAAAQDRAARMIGQRRPGHVRLVRLFPGIALPRLWDLVIHMVQPRVPFRRYLRPLGLALVDDPAPFAAEPAAAERCRP